MNKSTRFFPFVMFICFLFLFSFLLAVERSIYCVCFCQVKSGKSSQVKSVSQSVIVSLSQFY